MFKFPVNLYSDVRIEDVFETTIAYTNGNLDESKIKKRKAAFVRVFDGQRWYYASTSDVDNIQKQLDILSLKAKPNKDIYNHPIVEKFQVNKGTFLKFDEDDITKINKDEKKNLLTGLFETIKSEENVKMWKAYYVDNKKIQSFYSSKGAEIKFDSQRAGIEIRLSMESNGKTFQDKFIEGSDSFDNLKNLELNLKNFISKCIDFLKNSKPVEPGKYKVILSPLAAGVFAHESFGHKSESDFMVGDETMKKEWAIGKKVGSDLLSIVDNGMDCGSGYVPFDDEGTRAEKTYLIENGILRGRLHSVSTAASLEEELTGNCRAINFEYEPIVRMTTTYVLPGDKTKEQLFSEVEEGIYVESIKHGSGMSTFTLAPSLAYMIKDGKITDPVNVSVITGNVFETLSDVDGVSDKLELLSFILGGCGKFEQFGLPVGFGGPYVRIKNMNVQ
ncbi:TldD/PmbA family protein [Oceanirhabdus sp. W0125-5]|uniref:TldD/PmbA family protein n=1 Tax=Oceanirhabdus sp. W0125-5 TaxID=2999116 RepID=UPI0022F31CE3|nr:TldD/PmbA family protein [Oceanirhabdus sp. W0125-5]WBW97124.1 TldD/PmbA family protein [Oceanirhabdus sp. W0125-5]